MSAQNIRGGITPECFSLLLYFLRSYEWDLQILSNCFYSFSLDEDIIKTSKRVKISHPLAKEVGNKVNFTNSKFIIIKIKTKFVNIAKAGLTQKKPKGYISTAVNFEE